MRGKSVAHSDNDDNSRCPRSLGHLLDMPLAFLGFALWRAWVSLSYANPAALLPVNVAGGKLPYDIVLAACAVAIALLSPRLAPLAGRRWAFRTAALAWRSYQRYIPTEDRPVPSERRLIPWKFFIILALFELVATYSGAQIRGQYAALMGSHSTWTTLICGIALFVWVWRFSNRLPLSTLYRAPTLLICCGLLVVPLFGLGGSVVASFCMALGVGLFNAIVFLFLCDIAKRFGVSALLLFGIEESLLLTGWIGHEGALLFDGHSLFGTLGPAVGALGAIAVIAVVTVLVLNEREIGERWGIAFLGKRPPEENERIRLARRCAAVAEQGHLTPREREVMELLAQGKSLSGVAGELIIAEGTAKAHTRHIYEKLGINTRQELLDLLMAEA